MASTEGRQALGPEDDGAPFEVDPVLEAAVRRPSPRFPSPTTCATTTSAYHRSLAWSDTRWLGRRVPNAPTDLVAYQEILAEVRPDWVIETGSRDGGRPGSWPACAICSTTAR